MSARRALANAMLTYVTQPQASGGLGLTNLLNCGIMLNGKPMPNGARFFWAIHQGPRNNQWLIGDKSYFTLYVTISALAQVPFDRMGPGCIDAYNGLDDMAENLWTGVFQHQWTGQYSGELGVMTQADQDLDNWPSTYRWVEALFPSYAEPAVEVGVEWFNASSAGHSKRPADGQPQYYGFKLQTTFQGAVRMMNNADAVP